MKKVFGFILAMGVATSAYAACSTHSYFLNGKMVVCTTCCYNGNCNTTCF